MNEQHWQDWLVAVVGAWLVVSNWVLGYTIPETAAVNIGTWISWNATLSGIAAIVFAMLALAAFRFWEEFGDIATGLWLVSSPWVLGFADIRLAMWNVVLSGAVIILSAAWAIYDAREAGHA
jgi:hypothetical protein